MMSEQQRGIAALLLAACLWGAFSIVFKSLAHVPAPEVLAHRIVWSVVLMGGWLVAVGRLGELWQELQGRRLALTLVAAVFISVNWLVFIHAVQSGHALDASLGYYILPLISVLMGVGIGGERLLPVQWLAVGMAALAVVILAVGLGAAPWASLVIAGSFSLYGLCKKFTRAAPGVSVAAEVVVLLPFALLYLILPHDAVPGQEGHFGSDSFTTIVLILSGVVTVLPLALFSYGSQRAPLTLAGLTQYLNPTLQLLVAVLLFGEAFTRWHGIAFALIWSALVIFSLAAFRRRT